MNDTFHAKRVLVAPLDWGLGHAARCIPLIRYFLSLQCDVTIAASGKQKILLQSEFPNLPFLDLRGYNITYSKTKRRMPFKILLQIPKILKIIRYERRWLREVLSKHRFSAVISDNRYGLYNESVFSVFITHQLQIKASFRSIETILRRINYKYINHFSACWVPDVEGSLNLAGALSHPVALPSIPVKYMGPLSRFERISNATTSYQWMVIISGPEPQRSLFEKKILYAVRGMHENFLIIRGMPGDEKPFTHLPNCTLFNHLNTQEMQEAISASEFIIGRSGYTTVMEVLSLKKKSILIPTPGQTEQEYLAKHLVQQNWCYSIDQKDDFAAGFEKAKTFDYRLPEIDTKLYTTVLADAVASLP